MRYICLFILFYSGCKNSDRIIYTNPETLVVDSLTIEDSKSLSEFLYTEFKNDTMLITYNVESSIVSYYKRHLDDKIYRLDSSIDLPTKGYLPVLFKKDKNYFVGEFADSLSNNIFYKYNNTFKLSGAIKFNYNFKYLRNNFNLSSNVTSPIICKGDTLISVLYHNNARYIPEFYKENSLVEFVFKNDTVRSAKTYIRKPNNMNRFNLKATTYCENKNKIYVVYPMVDSIYTYNRTTKKEQTFPIYNRDFIMPQFSDNNINNEQYFKKIADYELKNFRYGAIFFNPNTTHFIIFYYLPIEGNSGNKQITFRDQKEFAIILNENLEILKYVKFNYKFFNQANYFFYPGKGLAMPVFKSKSEYEKTKYYIYNF